MITSIRSKFKDSAYRYIAFFIVAALALGMISIPTLIKQEKAAISWVVKINGKKIPYQDFAQEVSERSEWLAHVRAQYGQYADLLLQAMNISTDPKTLALEILIKENLMNQCAQSLDIHLHPDFITQSMNDQKFIQQYLANVVPLFIFDQSGALNVEKLKMFLQHKGMSSQAFENKVEHALTRLQALRFIESASYVPSFDSKQEYIATKLGKQFSYIAFPLEQFVLQEKKKAVTQEDLTNFYTKENTMRRRYWVDEKRDGIMWKFNATSYNPSISSEEIAQYYEDNKVNKYVLDPVKIQVKQISEKQLAPDISLEMVREEVQENPAEWNDKWELLAPFARGEKRGAFEQAAFVLQNVGDISPVVETKDGKVILQLVKRIPRTYRPLNLVQNEIKKTLIEKHFKKNFVKDIKSLIMNGDNQAVESFIIQKAGKKEIVSDLIKNDTQLSQELFALDKDQYAFFVENETGLLVRLTGIKERYLPELDSIKDIVRDDIIQDRASSAMSSTAEQALKALSSLSLKEVHQQFGGTLGHTDMIRPDDNKHIQELSEKDLPVREMLGLDKVGASFTHSGDTMHMLIKLEAIEPHSENMPLQAEDEVIGRLESMRTKLYMESIVASLHRNATIETNESILIAGEKYSE